MVPRGFAYPAHRHRSASSMVPVALALIVGDETLTGAIVVAPVLYVEAPSVVNTGKVNVPLGARSNWHAPISQDIGLQRRNRLRRNARQPAHRSERGQRNLDLVWWRALTRRDRQLCCQSICDPAF